MHKPATALKGIYRDVILNAEQEVIHDSGWTSNTIVDNCRILLAGFMKGDGPLGIQHLAVGQGDAAWDDLDAPPPSPPATIGLVNPYTDAFINVAPENIDYLDGSDDVQEDPAPRLQITLTLDPGYPPPVGDTDFYPLREFGLFGQFGTTDFMINSIRHPVIHKDVAATLVRVIRLYF